MQTIEINAIWDHGQLQLPQGIRLRGPTVKLQLRIAENDIIRTSAAPEKTEPGGSLEQRIAHILGPAAKARPAQTTAQDREHLIQILGDRL